MLSNQLQRFYYKLQDDESKCIFKYRLNYFFDHNRLHLKEMQESVDEYVKTHKDDNRYSLFDLQRFYAPEKRVILYGAGGLASKYIDLLKDMDIPVYCFCDSNPKKRETFCCGLNVIPPEELNKETDLICCSASLEFHDEVYEFLFKNDFAHTQMFFNYHEEQYFCSSVFSH